MSLSVAHFASRERCKFCENLGVSVEVLQRTPKMGVGYQGDAERDRERLDALGAHLASQTKTRMKVDYRLIW